MNRGIPALVRELAAAQKSRRGVSLYSRWVNRPFGRILAAVLVRIGATPNQVSVLSAFVTGTGLVVIAVTPPTPAVGAIAAALLVLGFALDSSDGQVARLTGLGSPAGEWLDHVIDAGKMVLVHAAVLITAYLHFDLEPALLLVPIAFQAIAVIVFVGGLLHVQLSAPRRSDASQPSRLRAVALLPADYGILAVSFLALGWPPVFAVVYALLLLANVAVGGALLAKWFRDLSGRNPVRADR